MSTATLEPAIVTTQPIQPLSIKERVELIKEEYIEHLNHIGEKFGQDWKITDPETERSATEVMVICKSQINLAESQLSEALSPILEKKAELKAALAKVDEVIKIYQGNLEHNVTGKYRSIVQNIQGELGAYKIAKRQQEEAELKARQEENARRVAEEAEKAKQRAEALGVDLTLAKMEEAKERTLATLNLQAEAETKSKATVRTDNGSLQTRISWKLDEENVDLLEIVKWVAKNPEHIGLLKLNTAYAGKWFKPTGTKTNPIKVEGLPFIQAATFI